jgi:uncharacterized protein
MQYGKLKKHIIAELKQRLNTKLVYHGLHHTLDVLAATTSICKQEDISAHQTTLAKTAALLHDYGFVEDKHAGHEEVSCKNAQELLPTYGYSQQDIEHICQTIMSTKIPQSPQDTLGQILCDADLDYLGRPDFYLIAESLFTELSSYGIVTDAATWSKIQLDFLESHRFFTETNKKDREPHKQLRISELQAKTK